MRSTPIGHSKLTPFPPSSSTDTPKKTKLQEWFSRWTGREKVHLDVMNSLNEVMSDPRMLTDTVAQKAASRIREKHADRGDKLQYRSVQKYLHKVATQRDRLRSDGLNKSLSDIFGRNTHLQSNRVDALKQFAGQPSDQEEKKACRALERVMGLPESAREIASFRAFVTASLANGGQPPQARERADVLEFARRWTAAMNADPSPTDIFDFGQAVDDVVKVLVEGFGVGPVPEPGLDYVAPVLLSADFHALCADLCKVVTDGDKTQMEAAAKKLGEKFALQLRLAPRDVQTAFSASQGLLFVTQLRNLLMATAGMASDGDVSTSMKGAAEKVFLEAVSVLSDKVLKTDTVKFRSSLDFNKIETRTVPVEVLVKSEVCRLKVGGQWTDGGLGMVGIFVSDSGKHQYALKMALPPSGTSPQAIKEQREKDFVEMIREARMHLAASTVPHDNVASLVGAMRSPDNSLVMVVESCPNGSLDDLIGKLPQLAKSAPVDAVAVRLNLAHQVLSGASHLHENARVAHRDIKGGNMLLARGGLVKIIDYGTSHLNSEEQQVQGKVENPRWLDPIVAAADHDKKALPRAINRAAKSALKAIPERESEARQLVESQRDEALTVAEMRLKKVSGFAADKWSVGMVLYQIYMNELRFSDKRDTGEDRMGVEIEVEVEALMRLPDDKKHLRLFPPGKSNHVPGDIQKIIVSLFDADPGKRMNFSDAMQSACFQTTMLGNPAASALIDRLTTSK